MKKHKEPEHKNPKSQITFQLPNFTQTPNQFIDEYMSQVSGSATKIYLAVCRKTIGWHKVTDYISISQLMEVTGLSNRAVIKALTELETIGLLVKERSRFMNKYTLSLEDSDEKSKTECRKVTDGVTKSHRQSDEKSHTKETNTKETQTNKQENKLENVVDEKSMKEEENKEVVKEESFLPTTDIERVIEELELIGIQNNSTVRQGLSAAVENGVSVDELADYVHFLFSTRPGDSGLGLVITQIGNKQKAADYLCPAEMSIEQIIEENDSKRIFSLDEEKPDVTEEGTRMFKELRERFA